MKLQGEMILNLEKAIEEVKKSTTVIYARDYSIILKVTSDTKVKDEDVEQSLLSPDFMLAVLIPREKKDRVYVLTLHDSQTKTFKLSEYSRSEGE